MIIAIVKVRATTAANDIHHRTAGLQMFYSAALTYIFDVKHLKCQKPQKTVSSITLKCTGPLSMLICTVEWRHCDCCNPRP